MGSNPTLSAASFSAFLGSVGGNHEAATQTLARPKPLLGDRVSGRADVTCIASARPSRRCEMFGVGPWSKPSDARGRIIVTEADLLNLIVQPA